MIFVPLIMEWSTDGKLASAASALASDLGLPIKNVYRWHDEDSIPAGWFTALIAAARRRGIKGVTAASLAERAAERRVNKPERKPRVARPRGERAA